MHKQQSPARGRALSRIVLCSGLSVFSPPTFDLFHQCDHLGIGHPADALGPPRPQMHRLSGSRPERARNWVDDARSLRLLQEVQWHFFNNTNASQRLEEETGRNNGEAREMTETTFKAPSAAHLVPGSLWTIGPNKMRRDYSWIGDVWEIIRVNGPTAFLKLRGPKQRSYGTVIDVLVAEHDWYAAEGLLEDLVAAQAEFDTDGASEAKASKPSGSPKDER